uniref:Uncharacterized protein n=1 Tax=Brassica campestris TaxID=3711 RepID=M4CZJ8_BRACM
MSRGQMLKKGSEGSQSSRRGDALFGLKDKLLGGGPYDLVGSLQPHAVVPSNDIETNECLQNNGGCWVDKRTNITACRCEEKTVCQCRGCKCKNTWGSYDALPLYIREQDICISKDARGDVRWGVIWIIIMGLGAAALGAYTDYKYRIRTYMDSEIRAIMAQYMPLDNHPNTQPSQLEL